MPKKATTKKKVQKAKEPELPVFEGVRVVKILEDDRDLPILETHYHCLLEDGRTAHVPKDLFENEQTEE